LPCAVTRGRPSRSVEPAPGADGWRFFLAHAGADDLRADRRPGRRLHALDDYGRWVILKPVGD
jgi:hypothetical protein